MSIMSRESKPKGWFSRRHQSSENHQEAQGHHVFKAERKMTADGNAALHASRTPAQQIEELDDRLGKGVGAFKERSRLARA